MVIFDFDGVIVDSEPALNTLMATQLRAYGITLSADEAAARFTGVASADCLPRIEAEFGVRLPASFVDDYDAAALALYASGQLTPIPGIAPLLAALRGPSCIASGSAPAKIAAGLASTGLDAHFGQRYVSARQVARGKPFPDVFMFAAERFGAAVEQCVVVEDSLTGVRAARAAGMPVFGLVGSFSAEALAGEGAVPVQRLGELLDQPRFRAAARLD